MKKLSVIEKTVVEIDTLLSALTKNETVDLTSFNLWSDALLRYVFYHANQRTAAQSLANLNEELILIIHENTERAIAILQQYKIEMERLAENATDLNGSIEWQPPFDRGLVSDYV